MSLRISGGRKLRSPPGGIARPTASRVRLAVMNLLAEEIPGCRWLDLCSGSGAMACEALQRGAADVVGVERDRRLCAVARSNLEAVRRGRAAEPGAKAPRARIDGDEVVRWLSRHSEGPFDVIYVDPPYGAGLYAAIGAAVARGRWLSPRGCMVWECPTDAVPEVAPPWLVQDRRRYGGTTVLLLQVQEPGTMDVSTIPG